MRTTKTVIPTYEFHDRSGIQKYLEEQGRKGWMLESLGKYIWKFRREEPKNRHFAVVYFPDADQFDPAPGEEEEIFQEFCAHGGWKLAASNAQIQIFWSERENPTPIETDPVLEVENIHRAMKKGGLVGYWLLILSTVLQLVVQGMAIRRNVLQYLSHNLNLLMAATWITLLFMMVFQLVNYYHWYKKARVMAREQNVFLETRTTRLLTNTVTVLLGLAFLAVIVTMENRRQALLLVLSVAAVCGIIALTELVRRKMQKDGWDAQTNRKTTLITTVIMVLILYFILAPGMADQLDVNKREGREEALAVTIWDLLGGEKENYGVFYLTDQESCLLQYQRIHQYLDGTARTDVQYELVRVKIPFLYDLCIEKMLTVPSSMELREIDPVPWGADRAWQVMDEGNPREWYVLCYGDTIMEIIPTWNFTDDQIEHIANSIK